MMKTCFKCGLEKPVDQFYRHKQMADGRLNKCISCARMDALRHRWDNVDLIRSKDRQRSNRPENVARRVVYHKTNKMVVSAHKKLHRAVISGLVRKPSHCSSCMRETNRLDGHHSDYSKPLVVMWLCRGCHRMLHVKMGEMEASKPF